MNNSLLKPWQSPNLEVLAQRLDLFRLIKDSHVRWLNRTDDPAMQERHRAVILLCENLMREYETLIAVLQ